MNARPWLAGAMLVAALAALVLVFQAWRHGGLALLQLGVGIC